MMEHCLLTSADPDENSLPHHDRVVPNAGFGEVIKSTQFHHVACKVGKVLGAEKLSNLTEIIFTKRLYA